MKQKYSLHLLLLSLSVSLLSSSMLACRDSEKNPEETTNQETETASITEETTESMDLAAANVPTDKDYNGHTFQFLITGNTENTWQKNDFLADKENGEAFNDARYQRNRRIEERFNVKIKTDEQYGGTKGAGTGFMAIQKAVMAGDTSYDAGMIAGYDCASLSSSGYLYDLNTLPYLDMTQRWWDQRIAEDLTIHDKLFYTTGDISTADNDATLAILFNKKIVQDHDIADPYQMVIDGTWTIDAMTAMGKGIASDLNGDSKYDKNDMFPAIIWDDTMMGIINAAGEKCVTVEKDGSLSLTLYNDRVLLMFEKFRDTYYDETQAYAYQRVSYDITDPVNMFANNQALFFMQMLDLVTYFRDMKTDFGILPLPKLDADQDRYYATISPWHSVFLCVPSVQEDAERTGIILESLAAESYNLVTPAYYEKTLVGKYIRDEQSEEMLDIILSSHVYDLGWFYQIGTYNDEVLFLWWYKKEDFTSMYEKKYKLAMKNLEKINEAFTELK